MTPLCRRHFEINSNEWKLVILIKLFCSTATHDLGYHMSRAVVTQAGQLRPIWLTLAILTGKLQTFFRWKCLNSDWYYIEICFKGVIYNKSALVQLITWCRASDRPLSESMLTQPLTHIYAALLGNVLKENRVLKFDKNPYLHISTKKTTWNQQMASLLSAKSKTMPLVYIVQVHLFGCPHLGQWPMTYLMTLSDWTMSCQPWPPRARYGQWARYK